MTERNIYDNLGHAHYVTFSCYKRRRLLDDDPTKRIVVSMLNTQLEKRDGKCTGFVVMPDHVHAVVGFKKNGQLSNFMKQWKQRSSVQIKKNLKENLIHYNNQFDIRDPVWQPKYYSFNLYSTEKIAEKICMQIQFGQVLFKNRNPGYIARRDFISKENALVCPLYIRGNPSCGFAARTNNASGVIMSRATHTR